MDATIQIIFLLSLAGLITGVAGGLFGIGGGTIIVPMLVILLGFEHIEAQGTSLAAMLLPVGLFGVLKYRKSGLFFPKASLLLGAGLLLGAWPGGLLANYLPKAWLKLFYALFLLYVSWRFIEPVKLVKRLAAFIKHRIALRKGLVEASGGGSQTAEVALKPPVSGWIPLLLLGLLGGVASGLFGIGGGAIIIPVLTFFYRYDHEQARVISLGALLPPVGIFGMIPYYQQGHVEITTAMPVALGIMAGAYFGALAGVSVPKKLVKSLYGIFLLGVVVRYLVQSLPVLLGA